MPEDTSVPQIDFAIPFAEAIEWARQREALLPDEFYDEFQAAMRARGFTVSGLATLDQIQQVLDSLNEATASGSTFREWQRALPSDVLSLGRARLELIFRVAIQTNYGVGRTIQQRGNKSNRPYLMWDAINDHRTRPTHAAMDNYIAPIDDPIWQIWHPPAGYNCRCTRISLTEAQAKRRGYPKPNPNVDPDPGWEGDPTQSNHDLLRIITQRQQSCQSKHAIWCDPGSAQDKLAELIVALIT